MHQALVLLLFPGRVKNIICFKNKMLEDLTV